MFSCGLARVVSNLRPQLLPEVDVRAAPDEARRRARETLYRVIASGTPPRHHVWPKPSLLGGRPRTVAWLLWRIENIYFLAPFRKRRSVGLAGLGRHLTFQRHARHITGLDRAGAG